MAKPHTSLQELHIPSTKSLIKPRQFPFYYGWFLLPVAIIGVLMSLPGQTAGFSAFTEPLLAVSHISRTKLSLAYMFGTMGCALLLPLMGTFVDKYGSRKMMPIACVLLSLTLVFLSQVDSIVTGMSEIFNLSSNQGLFFICFVVGIFGLRFLGQGMLPLCSNTMIGKWFEKSRGKAVAVMSVVNSLAFASAPVVLNKLVAGMGWKGAWIFLAVIVGGVMSFIAWLFYRDTPESCGLHLENEAPQKNENGETLVAEITGMTRGAAIRTLDFWLLSMCTALYGLVMTGFTFHIEAVGAEAGIPVIKAVSIFLPITLITTPLSFFASWMSHHIRAKFYILCMCAGEIIAFISIFFLDTPWGYAGSIIGLGIAGGLMGPIITTVVPKVFGRLHLGAISGLLNSIIVLASAIGPIFLSFVKDLTGRLSLAILYAAAVPFIILALSFKMKGRALREG